MNEVKRKSSRQTIKIGSTYLLDGFENVVKVLKGPFESRILLHHIDTTVSCATADVDDRGIAQVTPRVVGEQSTARQLLEALLGFVLYCGLGSEGGALTFNQPTTPSFARVTISALSGFIMYSKKVVPSLETSLTNGAVFSEKESRVSGSLRSFEIPKAARIPRSVLCESVSTK